MGRMDEDTFSQGRLLLQKGEYIGPKGPAWSGKSDTNNFRLDKCWNLFVPGEGKIVLF